MMGYGGSGGWMGFGGGIGMLLFWGLVIFAIVAVVSALSRGRGGGGSTSLQILDERYARGEIDREEYDRKRRDLRG